MFNNFLRKIYKNANDLNKKNILELLNKNKDSKVLDLGCGDGSLTLEFARKIQTKNIYGIDISEDFIRKLN